MSDEQRFALAAQIQSDKAKGYSIANIAHKHGLPESSVRQLLKVKPEVIKVEVLKYQSYNTRNRYLSVPRYWDLESIANRAAKEPEKIFFIVEDGKDDE